MDLKIKHMTWMRNIYQKFEAVCQEVDDIVGQDAVKNLENRVHNVGDSVKKFYSDVVQELLPLSPLVNSAKHGDCSMALKNNVDSSFKSIDGFVENNEKRDEENPVSDFIKPLQDCNATDPANDRQAFVSITLDLVNQISDETSLNSLGVEDSYLSQEEIDDDDGSKEASGSIKENLHVSIEQNAVESTPQLLNLISLKEEKPLEFSMLNEPLSGSSDCGHGALAGTKNNSNVSVEETSCLIVQDNVLKSSNSQVLNFMSHGEKGSFAASLFSEPSDGVDEDTCGMLAEVSPASSFADVKSPSSPKAGIVVDRDQCLFDGCGSESSETLASSEVAYLTGSIETSITKMEPSCFRSPLLSDSLCANLPGSYCFEIEYCKPTSQILASQDGLVSSGNSQSMESNEEATFGVNEEMSLNNSRGIRHGQTCSTHDRAIISLSNPDESLVSSIESSMEEIQLSDDAKLEESCVFVDDSELYAVSCRAQRLRSYKKRIRDAFASKKRLAKEYQQLAIWYGDADMEPGQGTSQTLLPFNPKRILESKNLLVQHECETEWELL